MKSVFVQAGFTIIEMLIAIVITGILLSVAIPSYQDFVKNSCLSTTSVSLTTAFQMARSEAVKRKRDVNVVAVSSGGTASWDNGWQVQDSSGNTVLRRFYKDSCDNTTISETDSGTNDSVDNDTSFTYSSTGFIDGAATLSICDDRENNETATAGKQVSISTTGRPKTTSKYTGSDCT